MATRVITVSRQIGSEGEAVARECARRFGFRLLDYQVLQAAAAEAGVSPEALSDAEHKPSLMARILHILATEAVLPDSTWQDFQSLSASPLVISQKYRAFIEDVVRGLAEEGNCVIIGHAAQVILRGQPGVVRVLVTGSLDARVKRLMRAMQVPEEKAREVAKRSDADRADYYQKFYETGWLSPASYDLCINTDRLSAGDAAELIEFAAR